MILLTDNFSLARCPEGLMELTQVTPQEIPEGIRNEVLKPNTNELLSMIGVTTAKNDNVITDKFNVGDTVFLVRPAKEVSINHYLDIYRIEFQAQSA